MRALTLVGLMLLLPVAGYGSDKIEPLHVKKGLWEVTYTSSVKGALPFSDDDFKNLTPEQRARLEMWKTKEAQGPQARTRKHCVTADQRKRDPFVEESPACTRTVVTCSSRELNVRVQCSSHGQPRNSTYRIQALTPVTVKGVMSMEDTSNNKTMDISGDFTARWIAPVCGTVK